MHALPLTYGKDMQEDKEPLFDAIDTIELCLDAADRDARRDRASTASGWPAAAGDEMLAATEIADLLVRRGRAVPRGARRSSAASSATPSRRASRSPS